MFPPQLKRRMVGKVRAQAPGDMYPDVPMMPDNAQTSPELEQQLAEQQLRNPQQGIQPAGGVGMESSYSSDFNNTLDMSGDMVRPAVQPGAQMIPAPQRRELRHDLRQAKRINNKNKGFGRLGSAFGDKFGRRPQGAFGSAASIQNATNKMQSPLIQKFRQKFSQRPMPVGGTLMPAQPPLQAGPGALPVQQTGMAGPQRLM